MLDSCWNLRLLRSYPNSVERELAKLPSFALMAFVDWTFPPRLLAEHPSPLRGAMQESLRRLQTPMGLVLAYPLSASRSLLTGKVNGN